MKKLLSILFVAMVVMGSANWIGTRLIYFLHSDELETADRLWMSYYDAGIAFLVAFILLFILCGWQEKN